MIKGKEKQKDPPKRYYRKRIGLVKLIDKIKLWPSRQGMLHGIKELEKLGELGQMARITTHCGKTFVVNDSRNSRSARWLRNKWFGKVCPVCKIPEWKLEKYSATGFKRHYGSFLTEDSKPKE